MANDFVQVYVKDDVVSINLVNTLSPSASGGAAYLDDLNDVVITSAASGDFLRYDGTNWVDNIIQAADLPSAIDATKIADGSISNTEFQYLNNVSSNIQTQINGKAASVHTHAISDVTNLQTTLDGKASSSHSHAISDVTGLQTALDAKVASNAAVTGATKTKITYDLKGLVTAGSDAAIADITGLQTALDGKQASLGFTAENVANKDIDGTLATNSDTKYPSQKAVKTYADTKVSSITLNTTGTIHTNPVTFSVSSGAATGTLSFVTQNKNKIFSGPASGSDATPTFRVLDPADMPVLSYNRQTSSYTLVLTDYYKVIEMNVATANNLNIPQNSSVAFPIGTQILVVQYGAGQTTFVADTNVILRSDSSKLKLSTQYTGAALLKVGTNEWYVLGALSA